MPLPIACRYTQQRRVHGDSTRFMKEDFCSWRLGYVDQAALCRPISLNPLRGSAVALLHYTTRLPELYRLIRMAIAPKTTHPQQPTPDCCVAVIAVDMIQARPQLEPSGWRFFRAVPLNPVYIQRSGETRTAAQRGPHSATV